MERERAGRTARRAAQPRGARLAAALEPHRLGGADRDGRAAGARPADARAAGAPMKWLLRWLVMATLWAALGAGAGLTLAVAGPYVFGGRSFTVMSGSMQPAIDTGDVVIDETIAPRDARVGDIVTFPDPDRG